MMVSVYLASQVVLMDHGSFGAIDKTILLFYFLIYEAFFLSVFTCKTAGILFVPLLFCISFVLSIRSAIIYSIFFFLLRLFL